jgi:beta-galactosidase
MRYYGAAYYPELLSPHEREADVARMAEAGVNVVRLAEGAWVHLEPAEGVFTFGWLDEVLDLCRRHEIGVVLGTPTFTPPAWLVDGHPEILPCREDGRVMGIGGRQHFCPHAEAFIAATRRIVRAMAEHFGHHPAVLGWQIHNEFGMTSCYCPRCTLAWQRWLEARYGTVDALNAAWGTGCWGQCYTRFAQIPLPSVATEPGEGPFPLPIVLAHRRFRSDDIRAYQQIQIEELRGRIGSRFLTHNAMGLDLGYDHFELFADLDVAAWDNYPPIMGGWLRTAAGHDITRALRPRAYWVLEQLCGSIGDARVADSGQLAAGDLTRWVLHSYAHGAEAVLFWLWRSLPSGNWPYWQGLLTPGGHVTPRFEEARRLGRRLERLRTLIPALERHSATARGDVAVLISYDNWWALSWDLGAPDFSVAAVLETLYSALIAFGLRIDVVSPQADLTAYRLVLSPALSLCTSEMARSLTSYVAQGGVAVLPPRAGRYTWEGTLALDQPPGALAEMSGVTVCDYDVLRGGRTFSLTGSANGLARWWCDLLELSSAAAIATFGDGPHQGRPAVTWNQFGSGGVLYLATYPDQRGMRDVVVYALRKAGIRPKWTVPAGCEVATTNAITCIFNHTSEERSIVVPTGLTGLEDLSLGPGSITLAPNSTILFTHSGER